MRITASLLLIFACFGLFGQQPVDKPFARDFFSNLQFAIKPEIGVAGQHFVNQELVESTVSYPVSFGLWLNRFFCSAEVHTFDFITNSTTRFRGIKIDGAERFYAKNTSFTLGYSLPVSPKWNLQVEGGLSMFWTDIPGRGYFPKRRRLYGKTTGIMLERKVLKGSREIVSLALAANYYLHDYSDVVSGLGNSSLDLGLIVGYRFNFTKGREEKKE